MKTTMNKTHLLTALLMTAFSWLAAPAQARPFYLHDGDTVVLQPGPHQFRSSLRTERGGAAGR